MRSLRAAGTALGVLLLPASIAPLMLLGVPSVLGEHRSLRARFADRGPLPAPPVRVSPRWAPLAPWRGAVPVLAYHGIDEARDGYSVSRQAFAEQMAMLRHAGLRAISIAQYVRFLDGDDRGLPARPILITFDDGRLDSYRGADAVLAREGMRATMFVITSQAGRHSPFYTDWKELRSMARSGRWDLQVHAGAGHHLVRTDAAGHLGPRYAYRRWARGRLESFAQFARGVTADIDGARAALADHVTGFRSLAFAAPYGNMGLFGTNDRRIPAFLRGWLLRRFRAVFVQRDAGYTTRLSSRDAVPRHEVRTGESADALYAWLRSRRPRVAVPAVAALPRLRGTPPATKDRARRHG